LQKTREGLLAPKTFYRKEPRLCLAEYQLLKQSYSDGSGFYGRQKVIMYFERKRLKGDFNFSFLFFFAI